MSPVRYEVRVAGTVPAEALLDSGDLRVNSEPPETVLRGALPDQGSPGWRCSGAQVVLVRRLGRG